MRDIKFRGKDYGNDWQYGCLVQEVWGQDKILMIKKNKREWSVLEDTIGQYLGLKDNNGTEIYEGDIVKVKNCQYHIGQVIYDTEYAEYEIEIDKNTIFPISVCYGDASELDIEVIGNIYDNPDLLKEAKI